MYRRGYTRGCGLTNDGTLMFCPNDNTARGQMGVFMIRAKLNNVFPTVFSGCPVGSGLASCSNSGDNFGSFVAGTPYFPADVPASHPFFVYIQKMREMRITNGTGVTSYSPDAFLTRGQMATFIICAFFF